MVQEHLCGAKDPESGVEPGRFRADGAAAGTYINPGGGLHVHGSVLQQRDLTAVSQLALAPIYCQVEKDRCHARHGACKNRNDRPLPEGTPRALR